LLAGVIEAESSFRGKGRPDRRRRDDDVVVVTLPANRTLDVRRTDLAFCESDGHPAVLLYGASPADVPRVLARTGVSATSVRTASDTDLLAAARSSTRS
jgi:hypothetical protein